MTTRNVNKLCYLFVRKSMQINLQHVFRMSPPEVPERIRMLWVAHATGQWIRRWRLVQCCSKRL